MVLDKARSRYGYEVLGYYFINHGRLAEAEQAFHNSLQVEPHFRVYNLLAEIQLRMKKYAAAEQNLQKALRLSPGNAEAIKNLSQLYFNTGNLQKAKRYLDLYRKDPRNLQDPFMNNLYQRLNKMLEEQGSK
jgi:Flp pilus assembly protein TadD